MENPFKLIRLKLVLSQNNFDFLKVGQSKFKNQKNCQFCKIVISIYKVVWMSDHKSGTP